MKKNGFTLIELLAVIVIIGLILVITSKDILGVIENSKMKATKYDVAGIFDDLSTQIHSLEIENKDYAGTYTVKDGKILEENNFDLKMKSNYNGTITINDDKDITAALGDNRYCVSRSENDYDVYPNQYDDKNCKIIMKNECFHIRDGVIVDYGDIEYQAGSETHYYVKDGGICDVDDLVIPDYMYGEEIIAIGDWVFFQDDFISVTLPSTLKLIGDYAFYQSNIEILNMPNSVKEIGDSAFESNFLENIEIPNSVVKIGVRAFNDNKIIGNSAYIYQRKSDGSIDNGNLISYAGEITEELNIISDVTKIGDYVFNGCNSYNSSPLVSVNFPNSLKSIGDSAFSCNNIEEIIFPDQLVEIGNSAFENNQLLSLVISGGIIKIGEDAFKYNQLGSLVLPNSLIELGAGAFADNQLNSLSISNSLEIIKENTFINNELTSLAIPNSVEEIGYSAFSNNLLSEISFPNSLKLIGDFSFANNGLTSLIIPESVYYIGDLSFVRNNLTSVVLKNSSPYIGNGAFNSNFIPNENAFFYRYNEENKTKMLVSYGGVNNQSLSIPNGTEEIADELFSYDSLSNLVLPDSLKIIGNRTFANNNLTSLNIPTSVNYIGSEAFANNKIASISISKVSMQIGRDAFDNNKLVGDDAFFTSYDQVEGINKLVSYGGLSSISLTIPEGVEEISNSIFAGKYLTGVTLPQTLKKIGYCSFCNNSLTQVIIPKNVEYIGKSSFYGNDLSEITFENGSKIGEGKILAGAFFKDDWSNRYLSVIYYNSSNKQYWDRIISSKDGAFFTVGKPTYEDSMSIISN